MNNKHQVHNLIILDESGSMESIKTTIIQGFNELVQTIHGIEKQFPEQEHFISFVSFNSMGQKVLHFMDPASKLKQIDDESYKPGALTPLLDAMGFSIHKLKHALQGQSNYNVLVTVLTDGAENASKEYSGNDIKKLVEELKQNSWTFTYIGTDHDVEEIASSLSIDNTLRFEKNEREIKEMFLKERDARARYSSKIHFHEDTSTAYFDDSDEKDVKQQTPPSNPTFPKSKNSLLRRLFGS